MVAKCFPSADVSDYIPVLSKETDATLQQVFANLKRRHIQLAIELRMLSGRDAQRNVAAGPGVVCGQGVEGYANRSTSKFVAGKIKKNGGEPSYIAMDEPLWYGHQYSKRNACQSTMQSLAQEIAGKIKDVRAVFPNVQIGDVEPLAPPVPDWNDQIVQWARIFKQVTGEPLSFFVPI